VQHTQLTLHMSIESAPLSEMNAKVQQKEVLSEEERSALWKNWLWQTDLSQKYLPEVGFNEHHLLGLILARDAANAGFAQNNPSRGEDIACLPEIFLMRMDAPFAELPTTMLMDTLDCLQCQWAQTMYQQGDDAVWAAASEFVSLLFKRTGQLVGSTAADDTIFNHIPSTEILAEGRVGMTQSAVRQVLDIFVILFRHLDLYVRYESVDTTQALQDAAHTLCEDTFVPHALEATKVLTVAVCALQRSRL